jgi:hypothetical protein
MGWNQVCWQIGPIVFRPNKGLLCPVSLSHSIRTVATVYRVGMIWHTLPSRRYLRLLPSKLWQSPHLYMGPSLEAFVSFLGHLKRVNLTQ